MCKLPKSEAWKQSDPDRPGTPTTPMVLEQKLSVRILWIPVELLYSSKLELRNHVGPRIILAELLRSSYEKGSRQAGRPSSPQSLATLPTRLHLATTLRMGAFQVESQKCGVCSDFHRERGICRGPRRSYQLGEVGNSPSGGWPA
jgi:hypothetical protein